MMTILETVLILAFCQNSLCNYSLCNKSEPVCLPLDYDKSVLPELHEPNRVKVSIHVDEVININQEDSSILFSGYFNVEWNDRRLIMEEFIFQDGGEKLVDLKLIEEIWQPNIYIYNLLSFEVENVQPSWTGVNSQNRKLFMDGMKNVLYQQKVNIKINCPMDMSKYPFDSHVCKLKVGSYSYNDSKIKVLTQDTGGNTHNKAVKNIAFDICKLKVNIYF